MLWSYKLHYALNDLYGELILINFLKDKVQFDDKKIKITFHNDFVLLIELTSHFDVYMNGVFYYNIEGQDILESILEIVDENNVFVEKNSLSSKRKVLTMSYSRFKRKKTKLIAKQKIKIYTIKELIYKSQ